MQQSLVYLFQIILKYLKIMKTFTKSTLFFMLILAIFSCSNSNPIDEIIEDDPIGDDYFVKATINGTNLINDEDDATAFTVVTDNGVQWAAFTGEFSDAENVIIGIKGFDGTGTYNLVDYEGSGMTYMQTDPSTGLSIVYLANHITGSGVITVTQYGGGTATGTFSFIGVNPIDGTEANITNGEFHILVVE